MKRAKYIEIREMAREALGIFNQYRCRDIGDSRSVFDSARAVGLALTEDGKIPRDVKDAIPLKHYPHFSRSVFHLVGLQSFDTHGGDENLPNALNNVISFIDLVLAASAAPGSIKVFYSWQTSLPTRTNMDLIRACIDGALEKINRTGSVEGRVQLDSDTAGAPGSPDVIGKILEKIDQSSIFIADVSLIEPKVSNSNVMFELGYAVKSLGDGKVILLFNEASGSPRDLPFDLGLKRQTLFTCAESVEDTSEVREELTAKLAEAISSILEHAAANA